MPTINLASLAVMPRSLSTPEGEPASVQEGCSQTEQGPSGAAKVIRGSGETSCGGKVEGTWDVQLGGETALDMTALFKYLKGCRVEEEFSLASDHRTRSNGFALRKRGDSVRTSGSIS